ncbi:MAG: flagellar biosynthesis regulator FlaF [Alphaproteobacteria bacterium]|nr:flagellar biosynthesis regulator FlaF [Alphaproteobacteria bacterium]
MHHNNKNPYTAAAGAYGSSAATTDPRALEGMVLMKAAQQLETLAKAIESGEYVSRDEIGAVLTDNKKLWQVFVSDTMNPDHPLPQEIKNNIATLALFIFKRTLELLADTNPDKIQALIDINRNIAAGVLKKPAGAKPDAQPSKTDVQPIDSEA